jgi:hypothetical protein
MLKLVAIVAILGIAVSICFWNRRMFLTSAGSMAKKELRLVSVSLLFIVFAVSLALWAVLDLTPPEWKRTVYSVLPLAVLTCYVLEVYLITRLSARWRKSPWFWMVAVQPIVGCLLVILIWWRENHNH